jgi:hypothetical protein
MRKFFFQMMVSLDGYFEPPDKINGEPCRNESP